MKCKAIIHTDPTDSEIVKELGQHVHAANAAKLAAKGVVGQLRTRARETQEAPHQIIANVTAGKSTCFLLSSSNCISTTEVFHS